VPSFAIKADRDQLVTARLAEVLGADLAHEQQYDLMCYTVPKEHLHEILRLLRDELGFNFLTTLCGIHYPGAGDRELGVVYHLHNMRAGHRIRIKSFTSLKEATFDTVTDLWPTANWMEREAWDFFGIKFTGHPNLKRILNMEDFPAFPLRKDYPMEDPTRQDKNDSMFGR
jgi:NADH-quinone oxidoreductase subunit C